MKILRSRKALSPVVASIILIAVTVAVSIAVAAWMGALTFSFMGSGEQLNVGSPWGWTATLVNITASCPGGGAVTVQSVRVNGTQCVFDVIPNAPIQPVTSSVITVTSPTSWMSGYYYTIVVVTTKNHEFQTTGMAP
jgi:flagellin-like protein